MIDRLVAGDTIGEIHESSRRESIKEVLRKIISKVFNMMLDRYGEKAYRIVGENLLGSHRGFQSLLLFLKASLLKEGVNARMEDVYDAVISETERFLKEGEKKGQDVKDYLEKAKQYKKAKKETLLKSAKDLFKNLSYHAAKEGMSVASSVISYARSADVVGMTALFFSEAIGTVISPFRIKNKRAKDFMPDLGSILFGRRENR